MESTGHVKHLTARIEERYRRAAPDLREHRMVLYEPELYSAANVAETRYFRREQPERITYFGWYGLFSGVTGLMGAPMNAIERYRDGAC